AGPRPRAPPAAWPRPPRWRRRRRPPDPWGVPRRARPPRSPGPDPSRDCVPWSCLSDAQQALEERVRLGNEDPLLARVAFVIGALLRHGLRLVLRHVYGKRDGVGGVRPPPARRRMVRHHHDAPLAAAGAQAVQQRAEDVLVDPLDGGDLL